MNEYWETATEAQLREAVAEALSYLRGGPCSSTEQECAGCTVDWNEGLAALILGPYDKRLS